MVDVAIVGAGPVGLGLAVELGQRGAEVEVYERTTTIHRIPKGQNLTQRSAEHLRAWGVLDEVEAARLLPAGFGTGGVTTYGTILGPWAYDWWIREDVRPFYAERNIRIPQYLVEEILRARIAALPNVALRLGARVTDVMQPDAPVVMLEDGGRVEPRFVVGCDGARSVVRPSVGITETYRSNFRRMVLAVFRSPELNRLLEARYPGRSTFNALHPDFEGYWQFLGRVDMETWFFHAPVPPGSTTEDVDLPARLARAVGQEFDFQTEYLGFWDLRIAIADRYRQGKVFIAGDAAHSHPPYGGFGVNNGFEDVRNLGWKLDAMLKGWAGPGLLPSYEAERRPVFSSTADDFIARMIEDDRAFLEAFDPHRDRAAFEAEWARRSVATKGDITGYAPHYMGSPIVRGEGGPPSAVGVHEHRARAGCHLSPKGDVTARLGRDHALIAVGPQSATNAFEAAARAQGVPLDIVTMERTPETEAWQADLILLRPDRFVAWAGSGEDAYAAAILEQARGA